MQKNTVSKINYIYSNFVPLSRIKTRPHRVAKERCMMNAECGNKFSIYFFFLRHLGSDRALSPLLSGIKRRNDVQTAKQSKTRRPLAASQARMNKTGIITMRPLSATILKKDPITTTVTTGASRYTLLTFLQFTKYKH